jgi:hypothetical protein
MAVIALRLCLRALQVRLYIREIDGQHYDVSHAKVRSRKIDALA